MNGAMPSSYIVAPALSYVTTPSPYIISPQHVQSVLSADFAVECLVARVRHNRSALVPVLPARALWDKIKRSGCFPLLSDALTQSRPIECPFACAIQGPRLPDSLILARRQQVRPIGSNCSWVGNKWLVVP